jgi:hypothetical protein
MHRLEHILNELGQLLINQLDGLGLLSEDRLIIDIDGQYCQMNVSNRKS